MLLAEELSPSAVSVLNSANVAGIVLGKGGPTSHSAILARALEIPAVLGVEDRVLDTAPGEEVIVDGNRGCAVFSPRAQVMRSVYESRQREFLQLRASLREFVGRQTVTAEGQRITCLPTLAAWRMPRGRRVMVATALAWCAQSSYIWTAPPSRGKRSSSTPTGRY